MQSQGLDSKSDILAIFTLQKYNLEVHYGRNMRHYPWNYN